MMNGLDILLSSLTSLQNLATLHLLTGPQGTLGTKGTLVHTSGMKCHNEFIFGFDFRCSA
jgi:hypothetical protein